MHFPSSKMHISDISKGRFTDFGHFVALRNLDPTELTRGGFQTLLASIRFGSKISVTNWQRKYNGCAIFLGQKETLPLRSLPA